MRARLEEAVVIRRELGDAAGLGRSLPFLGLAIDDDRETARRFAAEGVALCRAVGDRWGLALALTNLGRIEATWGDDVAARPPLEEATALFHALGDGWLLALPRTSLGAIAYRAGNHEDAQAAFAEALPCFRAVEDRRNTTQVLTNLGYVALARGEVGRARAIFAESLAFGREHGDRFNAPACLRGFGTLAIKADDPDRAAYLFAAADELFAATGSARWPAERLGGPVATDEIRALLGAEAFALTRAAGRAQALEDTIAELAVSADEAAALEGAT
jgi:tetratricopeptide (TPR) repeat protein